MGPCAVGIVAALAAEARSLGPAPRRGGPVLQLASGARLAVTGIGCAPAADGARRLVACGCRALASWGLAGGLDPSLPAGSVLLPEEIAFEGRVALRTAADWLERVARTLGSLRPRTGGTLLTSPRAIGAPAEKARTFAATGALATDMESYAIAAVAAQESLPFIAVRVIVDTALDEVPAALMSAADAAGVVSMRRVLGEMAVHPTRLPALLLLARRYRIATRALRAVARTGALTGHAR